MTQKKQVLEILTQAINIAVSAGAYKNSKDVAVINQALDFLEKDYKEKDVPDSLEKAIKPAPKEKK